MTEHPGARGHDACEWLSVLYPSTDGNATGPVKTSAAVRPMTAAASSSIPTRQTAFDYDRTVVAFHGTRRSTASKLVAGEPFGKSENDDDWLGHGIYFWEFAPQQAWWWAERRYGGDAAVVGSLVRLGRCIDLLDPSNADLLATAHEELDGALTAAGHSLKNNAHTHKYRDCAVFNYLFAKLQSEQFAVERRPFVPPSAAEHRSLGGKGTAPHRAATPSEHHPGRTHSTTGGSRTTSWPCGR